MYQVPIALDKQFSSLASSVGSSIFPKTLIAKIKIKIDITVQLGDTELFGHPKIVP